MTKTLLFALTFIAGLSFAQATHWAVLVAGSKSYENYRHQADIFHAYQVLKKYGILPENIITFAYDDVPHSFFNPYPGKMFNKPSIGPGVDVYEGVVIDYKGLEVTPKNFLNVLQGGPDSKGRKVLKSTSEDNVFVYFADHGAVGLLAFPHAYLFAKELLDALTFMEQKKMYKQMVIYIEACDSGSMLNQILPNNISIYATTASNSAESSWATYCAPNNTVDGKSLHTCLGDLYSVNFLENLESVNPALETLMTQYLIVKNETIHSHVQQFGQMDIADEEVDDFEGNGGSHAPMVTEIDEFAKYAKKAVVSSRMNRLAFLQNFYEHNPTEENHQALVEEIESISKYDNSFYTFVETFALKVDEPVVDINFDCLKMRVEMYEAFCGKFSDYGLKYVKYIHYSCVQGVDDYEFEAAIATLCL